MIRIKLNDQDLVDIGRELLNRKIGEPIDVDSIELVVTAEDGTKTAANLNDLVGVPIYRNIDLDINPDDETWADMGIADPANLASDDDDDDVPLDRRYMELQSELDAFYARYTAAISKSKD